MRLFVMMILAGIVMVAFAGCQTMTEILAAAGPFISESVANSLAAALADAMNQGASGNPVSAEATQAIAETITGALNGALKGAHEAQLAAIQRGQDATFWNTMIGAFGGSMTGGGSAGVVAMRKMNKLVASEPVKSD